ncbi:Nucleolar protein 9 [Stygiomarasmius scandens]|uniref:Nucleolar protein 9 n=1 Tax=Marasmiellus scandens TaxID=2682957 RepID=A0ABR1K8B9_9AGAR
MPRENRKRGKKNKKKTEDFDKPESLPEPEVQSEVGPSWIIPSTAKEDDTNAEAPFGYVDTDVKAYFRTVDTQIRDWQDGEGEALVDENSDPNAERQMFFMAALNEMTGKEKQLATDPDCSIILERMAYSMDDFVRRVFMDSLCGSYETLVKHRFASHVCQTMITVAAETVSRETAGTLPSVPGNSDRGELRTMTQLILDICEELLPSLSTLVMDPFASHVVRALLALLSPAASSVVGDISQNNMRSKKSASWKARQGQLKSVFDSKGKGKEGYIIKTPPEFQSQARVLVKVLKKELGDNEVRALAADKVASPCLTMLLEVEALQGMSDQSKSLMDRITMGVISASLDDADSVPPSDYLGTLFRDPTSSHLLEVIVSRAPDKPFSLIWNTYMKGKLARLGAHPVANFVIAKALERANTLQLEDAYDELKDSWEKIINSSRSGVLRAIVDRSVMLHSAEDKAMEAAFIAFGLETPEDRKLLVPCALHLQTLQVYQSKSETQSSGTHHKGDKGKDATSQSSVQGSLLLQSLLKLPETYTQVVIDSFISLDIEERLSIAHDPTASRFLDALLESSTVSAKSKRAFIMSFIGHFHLLADDRIGSRICDRIFTFADTYLKEKIGRSLIPHEQALAASYYGKFFSRNLNLYLLQRRPDEWKNLQSNKKNLVPAQFSSAEAAAASGTEEKTLQTSHKKRKRDKAVKDEIDEVFEALPTKKTKASSLASSMPVRSEQVSGADDPTLRDVFSAIRSIPKNSDRKNGSSKKKKH